MMLMYKIKTNNAHLMFGLREKVKLSWNQKSQVSEIMDMIEELDEKLHELFGKFKVENIKEAVEKAKKDKNLDKELIYFMNKIYPEYQSKIVDKVKIFNEKYCVNYSEVLKELKK